MALTRADLLRLLPIGLGTLVVPLDTAVNVAFPGIAGDLDLPVTAIQWIVICYVLTYGSLMLAVGRIGDIFGHDRVFRLGLVWSAAALLLCALAPGFGALLVCRVLQGIGAALVIGCGPALATGLVTEALRGRALAAYAAAFATGSALGPLLGGLLVQGFGWEAVFWFRAPIAIAALILLRRVPAPPRAARREPFDGLGALLLTVAVATLLLAVNRAPAPLAAGLGLVALACFSGFVRRSRRSPHPIIDLALFRRPGFAGLNLANLLVNLAGFAVMLMVPFYLAGVAGLPATLAGFALAAGPAGIMLGSTLGGWGMARGRAGLVMGAGASLSTLGLLLIGLWGIATPVAFLLAALLVQGIGIGLFTLAYADTVTALMPRADRGVAGSLTMLTRTLGIVLAASLLTLLFGGVEAAALAAGAPPPDAFLAAFRRVFQLVAALPVLALLLLNRPGRKAPPGPPGPARGAR